MASLTTPTPKRSFAKPTLWTILAIAVLFVIATTEFPILREPAGPFHDYFLHLKHDRLLLFPHALCGTLALVLGPVQFSTRLRRKNLQLHRYLGRVYVYSVFIAAPVALILTRGSGLEVGTWVQAGAWIVCTLFALLTARNRHIVQHRQWMIRSYAVTFTFVTLRIPDPWPAYFNMSPATNTLVIIVVTFLSVFLPDIAFNWREITTRRT